MLEEGIFDIHCHIVPGVDDGAADIEETRKLLEMEYKQGVRNIILTPHFRFQMFETPLEKVQRQFRLAEEAAADISKDLHLYLGCEFHANMEMQPQWMKCFHCGKRGRVWRRLCPHWNVLGLP